MTNNEFIEQNVRLIIGDLTLQTVMLRARVQELEQQLAEDGKDKPEPVRNGKFDEAVTRQ